MDQRKATEITIVSPAMLDVMNERQRQIDKEGYSHDVDDIGDPGRLATAGATYALHAGFEMATGRHLGGLATIWPFNPDSWKPADARRNLVKAGALILAEIERLDRRPESSVEKEEVAEVDSSENSNEEKLPEEPI